jgi:hypothetical protein
MVNIAFLFIALAAASTTGPTMATESASAVTTPSKTAEIAISSSVASGTGSGSIVAFEFPQWFVPTLLGKFRVHAYEDDAQLPENKTGFRNTLLEIGAKGELAENWTYRFKVNAAIDVEPLDYYTEYEAVKALKIRAGQFKAPFGRQEISHTGELALPDRALVAAIAPGRDIGAMVHGELHPRFGYALGLFNGEGKNLARNINNSFLSVGRIVVTPWGKRADAGEAIYWRENGLTLGANGGYNRHGDLQNAEQYLVGGDLSLFFQNFGIIAEWDRVVYNPPGFTQLPSFHRQGFYVEPMIQVWRGWEWVIRYERNEPNSSLATIQQQETEAIRIGTNVYLHDGRILLQLSYGKLAELEGPETMNNEIIAQLQVRME